MRGRSRVAALALLFVSAFAVAWWWTSSAGGRGPGRATEPKAGRDALANAARSDAAPLASPASARVAEPDVEFGAAPGPSTASGPRATVIGRVHRVRDGSPVRNGTVVLSYIDFAARGLDAANYAALDPEARVALHDFDEAHLDADGRFVLELPWPGVVRRAVIRPDLTSRSVSAQFLETEHELGERALDRLEPLDLDLAIDEGAAIEGVVVAAQGGFPLAGAGVLLPWWSDEWSDWACLSDAEGRFRIAGIRREVAAARSHAEAIAEAPGYVTRRFEVPAAGDDLDVVGLRLALERGVSLVVLLEQLEPAAAESAGALWHDRMATARAWLQPAAAASSEAPIRALPWRVEAIPRRRGDDSFEVRFDAIPPTRDVELLVLDEQGRLLATTTVDATCERSELHLPVAAPPTEAAASPKLERPPWRVRLLDGDGTPLREVDIAYDASNATFSRQPCRRTDDAGWLELDALRPGEAYALRAARFETMHLFAAGAAVATTPMDRFEVEVRLRPLAPAR